MGSNAAISIATRVNIASRTKHIDLKDHYGRDLVTRSIIIVKKLPTHFQVADDLKNPEIVPFLSLFSTALRMPELN